MVWFSFRLVTTSAAKSLPAAISKLLQYVISWRADSNGTYSIARFPGHWVIILWRCRFPINCQGPLHVLLCRVMEQTSPKFANLYDRPVKFSCSLPSNSQPFWVGLGAKNPWSVQFATRLSWIHLPSYVGFLELQQWFTLRQFHMHRLARSIKLQVLFLFIGAGKGLIDL